MDMAEGKGYEERYYWTPVDEEARAREEAGVTKKDYKYDGDGNEWYATVLFQDGVPYKIGFYVGDATKEKDVAKLMDGQQAHMGFTDPPYNVAYGDHGGQQPGVRKRRLKNDAMPPEQWAAFCEGWTKNLIASVDGAVYVCMNNVSNTPLVKAPA